MITPPNKALSRTECIIPVCLLSIEEIDTIIGKHWLLRYGERDPQFRVKYLSMRVCCTYSEGRSHLQLIRRLLDQIGYEPDWAVDIIGNWLRFQ